MSTSAERLKVHRRSLRLDGLEYTVLSPRPSEVARFATTGHHEIWHIVTDAPGAQLLARLSWAMAFQQRSRTFVVIDSPLLVPNPFDAEPSTPIVIVNHDLGTLGLEALKDLRSQMPLQTPSMGTVVLQTRGLDAALEDEAAFLRRDDQAAWRDQHQQRRWIDGTSGLLVMTAPPPVLRGWGVELSNLGKLGRDGLEWSYLDHPEAAGEVQVIGDLGHHVEAAIAVREQMFPGQGDGLLTDDQRAEARTARRTNS